MKLEKIIGGAAALIATSFALSGTAGAHVTIAETDQVAGEFGVLTFAVGHGCGESPTEELSISIPDSVLDVTPTLVPGWDVDVVTEDLPEPVEGAHGEETTTRESEVVYTAQTALPDGFRQAFALSLQIPEDAADTTLYFPAVQTCTEGENAWIEIPEGDEDPFSLESPSPFINVSTGTGDGHGGGDDHGAADDAAEDGEVDLASASATGTDDSSDDGTDALSVVALIVGALGLAAGGWAAFSVRRSA